MQRIDLELDGRITQGENNEVECGKIDFPLTDGCLDRLPYRADVHVRELHFDRDLQRDNLFLVPKGPAEDMPERVLGKQTLRINQSQIWNPCAGQLKRQVPADGATAGDEDSLAVELEVTPAALDQVIPIHATYQDRSDLRRRAAVQQRVTITGLIEPEPKQAHPT
jgi:hypothetical protein